MLSIKLRNNKASDIKLVSLYSTIKMIQRSNKHKMGSAYLLNLYFRMTLQYLKIYGFILNLVLPIYSKTLISGNLHVCTVHQ